MMLDVLEWVVILFILEINEIFELKKFFWKNINIAPRMAKIGHKLAIFSEKVQKKPRKPIINQLILK